MRTGCAGALNKFNAGRNSFGISVEICAPLGAQISERTYNPRLGILGGISILGTSGIVEPMSEQALIDTIKVEMKVLKAAGKNHIFLTPGNYGEEFAAQNLHLPLTCAVKTSNFIGDSLDLACELKFESVLLVGHMGKLIKLAGGIFNTHSKYADARMEIIAAHGAQWGAGEKTVRKIMECITTDEALSCFEDEAIKRKTIESIINKIDFNIKYRTKKQIKTGIVLFSKEYGLLGKTQNVHQQICKDISAGGTRMKGILYGVSIGPGDPELITLKAVNIIQSCDIIAVPAANEDTSTALHIVRKVLPEIDSKKIIQLFMPMTRDKKQMEEYHQKAANIIKGYLDQANNVAMLTLGDATITLLIFMYTD